jgi:hypothetical protein
MPNLEPHGFEFTAKLMIPKPQDFDSLRFEEPRPLLISCAPLRKTMASTIEFNRELCHRAVEIQEVDATGVLPAELELVETAMAQQTPHAFLGIGGIFSELAREVARRGGARTLFAVLWRSPPHPNPLPRWGRGKGMRIYITCAVCFHHVSAPRSAIRVRLILFGTATSSSLSPSGERVRVRGHRRFPRSDPLRAHRPQTTSRPGCFPKRIRVPGSATAALLPS